MRFASEQEPGDHWRETVSALTITILLVTIPPTGRNCRIFQSVVYKNIYPNIDVRYYSTRDIKIRPDSIS